MALKIMRLDYRVPHNRYISERTVLHSIVHFFFFLVNELLFFIYCQASCFQFSMSEISFNQSFNDNHFFLTSNISGLLMDSNAISLYRNAIEHNKKR